MYLALCEREVESIIDHKGGDFLAAKTVPQLREIMFKVRWQGYDDSEDTWEPYCDVRSEAAFKQYKSSLKNSGKKVPKQQDRGRQAITIRKRGKIVEVNESQLKDIDFDDNDSVNSEIKGEIDSVDAQMHKDTSSGISLIT
jgi:hypothetical protein